MIEPLETHVRPMLEVRDLRKSYVSSGRRTEAIGGLSLDVGDGELVCVVGPSGCGKTTLLRCVAGLLTPDSGTITIADVRVSGPPANTAVVFQEYGRSLFPWLRVGDNIALPLRQQGLPAKRRAELVAETLESVGLDGVERSYPWQLSGGMQQRVAIARAIACRPSLLLMDEPFAAVDAQTRADLEDLIRQLWLRLNITVLFITHDIDESVYLGQRVLVLSGAPTSVREEVVIDLPEQRDQLSTRADTRFAALRSRIYRQIQSAKREVAS